MRDPMNEIANRTHTYDWRAPLTSYDVLHEMDGKTYLQAIIDGIYPVSPMAQTLGLELTEIEDGYSGNDDDDLDDVEEADTQATIGEYRFTIERHKYLDWMEDIKQSVGFEKENVTKELQKRLGL